MARWQVLNEGYLRTSPTVDTALLIHKVQLQVIIALWFPRVYHNRGCQRAHKNSRLSQNRALRCGTLAAVMDRTLLAATLLLAAPLAFAQKPEFKFEPGQWQIDSTVTASPGQTAIWHASVCAKTPDDTVNRSTTDQQCDAPTIRYLPDGIRVLRACRGGSGPFSWRSQSDVTEVFSANGDSFSEKGNVSTSTTFPGSGPITFSATVQANGHNTGSCTR